MRTVQKTLTNWSIWNVKDKELLDLTIGREGGKTTVRIMDKLLERPHNKNQLAKLLGLDYNTITYHINIICKHEYISEEQFEHNSYYHPTEKLFKNIDEYKIIRKNVLNKKK